MSTPSWHRIEELFQRAIECSGQERERLLAGAAEPDLRSEVESLLAVYESSTSVLESCLIRAPVPDSAPGWAPAWEGRRLGPYVLLREIGHGGMSRVYLAARADAEFERLVVVKVLEPEFCSPSLLRRFLSERQILADLDHPGIAKLLDGGTTEEGVPYLVLELVDGPPIDRYCDRHRLSIRQRVALFLEVCAAVEHAHRNLVIHRDLKPSNILITAEGRAKLLDFGIAKLLAPERRDGAGEVTRTILHPLTPRYASPEQLRGASLTTATDVYSLGVVLYELLVGDSLFDDDRSAARRVQPAAVSLSGGLAVVERDRSAAAEVAARRHTSLRALKRQLSGDLDTVVRTALEDDLDRRYPSVARLTDDLERWLASRPIGARRWSFGDRAAKLVRRNPWAAVLAGTAILLLVLLAAGQIVQSRRVARERDTAEQALSFLTSVFHGADPATGGAERVTLPQLLDAGAARVQEELSGAPEAQARMLEVLGEVYADLGLVESAQPLFERSLELRRAVHGECSREVALVSRHLGEVALRRSDLADAERWLRRSVGLYRDLGGEPAGLAAALEGLGETLAAGDRYEEAEPLLREALELQRRPGLEGHEAEAAETCVALADLLRRAGRWDEVGPLLEQALELRRRTAGDRSAAVASSLNDLGIFLATQGRYRDAVEHYAEVLGVWRALHEGDHPEIARALHNLGVTLLAADRLEEAESRLGESLAMLRRLHGETHLATAFALDSWGSLLILRGELEEAERTYEQVLAIRRQLLGERHSLYAGSLMRRGKVRRLRGRWQAAEADLTAALELLSEAPQQLQVAPAMIGMGRLDLDRGRIEEAEAWFRQALDKRDSRLAANQRCIAETRIDLACALLLAGRRDAGERLLRQGHAVLREWLGADHQRVIAAERLVAALGAPIPPGGPTAELSAAAAAWRASF